MSFAMALQKSFGGRPISKGQSYLIWVVAVVFCLVIFQFWVYEKTTLSVNSSNVRGSRKAFNTMLMKSWFLPDDGNVNNNNRDARRLTEMLQLVALCNSSAGIGTDKEERVKTSIAECRNRLLTNQQSLQPSLLPPLCQQLEACQNEVHARQIEALQNEIDTMSGILKNSTVFMELKDTREEGLSDTDTTWFMSSIHWAQVDGNPEELEFPSELSGERLLCLMGNNRSDGTQNKYGFAPKGYLSPDATLLPGLTFVADNYWDYWNIWHGLSALAAFVSWRGRNGCEMPQRILLYHWGELVPNMGSWIDNVLHASFGRKLEVEMLEHGGSPLVCLERAIVNRRGLGPMSLPNMNSMIETIRCRSRKFCGVVVAKNEGNSHTIQVTMLVRTGPRAFKNETAVRAVIEEVCAKFGSCHLEVAYASSLTFCEQVALLSRTEVLITTHGAQMTNILFMSQGGSVMEMIPKGWFEFAGVGQYIYSWLASWANLDYEGVWRDPEGPDCPYPTEETLRCFLFYKDLPLGHNETHLAEWTKDVLERQLNKSRTVDSSNRCTCDGEDSSSQADPAF